MVRLEGGTFTMGSAEFYPDETPVHERTVAAFEVDAIGVERHEKRDDRAVAITRAEMNMSLRGVFDVTERAQFEAESAIVI